MANAKKQNGLEKIFIVALLLFPTIAQHSHPLSEITDINTNLDMNSYDITNVSTIRIGNSQSSYIHFSEDATGAGFSIVFDGAGTGDSNYLYVKGGASGVGSHLNLLRVSRDSGNVALLSSGTFSVSGTATMNAITLSNDDITNVESVVGSSTLELEGSGGLGIHITSGGNVGVGAVPGSYKLDVSGAGRLTGDLTVSGGNLYMGNNQINDLSGAFELYSDNSDDDFIELQSNDDTYGVIIREDVDNGGSEWGNLEVRDGKLSLGFNNDAGGLTITDQDCVRIDAGGGTCTGAEGLVVDGSVGIGTASPSSKLEVTGSIETSGLLDADGSSFFDGGCSANQHVTGIDSTGAITCAADSAIIETVSAGNDVDGGGTSGDISLYLENNIDLTSLEVSEPIRYAGSDNSVILYGLTGATGIPTGDGFRIRYDEDMLGDTGSLVFTKTDSSSSVDGGIAFRMRGTSANFRAMEIKENGDVGIKGNLYAIDGSQVYVMEDLYITGDLEINDVIGPIWASGGDYINVEGDTGTLYGRSFWSNRFAVTCSSTTHGAFMYEQYCDAYNRRIVRVKVCRQLSSGSFDWYVFLSGSCASTNC
ncbi:hypothetical protein E2P64_00210 [Candidatus Bathyarchaeota archaeon]|nr:hypothetical protein E2P64_00210 [Candidatus Bathyarchaeota archaeon]